MKIGLPFWKTGVSTFGATLPYIEFIERFGEVVPLMANHAVRRDLDMVVLPGGPDVDPARYGKKPHYYTGKPDMFKEYFDRVYLQQYIDLGIPIFGICRGHQSLAVHLGGTLIQHMHHETNPAEDPCKVMHKVEFDDKYAREMRKFVKHYNPDLEVNSRHHQVVDGNSLGGTGLCIVGRHEVDNTVELIAHEELPIFGIQAHPEDIYAANTYAFIENVMNHLLCTKRSILK